MHRLDVVDFEWDDLNETHCAAHGVWPEDLDDALTTGEYVMVRNRKGRTGSHLFIGSDRSGRCIAAAVVATGHAGVWRPISAWPCKPHEERHLR